MMIPFPRRLTSCLLACACLLAPLSLRAEQLVEGVAAIVDDDVILLSEVENASGMMLARIQQQQGDQPLPPEVVLQVKQDALKQLIDARIMSKFAERVNLEVTPEEIDETVAGIASDEGLTADEIYAAAQREGLTRDDYRRELGNQITQMKVMSGAVRSRIEVDDDDVKQLFKERFRDVKPGVRARVRQIFLPWPGEGEKSFSREEVRALAEQVRRGAIETGDFAELARRFSQAPSAATGGLTTLRQGEVTDDIAVWVFDPPIGSISPVIETSAGCNLFQVLERVDPSQIEFEQVEGMLRAELAERRMEPEFNRWIADQREQYYIEIVAPGLE